MTKSVHRFILLADLHLSDNPDTAAHQALQWAVDRVNLERPDFLAVAGDMTTFATAVSAARCVEALGRVEVPVLFTPGNADRRGRHATSVFETLAAPGRRAAAFGDLLVLLPDTSTGTLPCDERSWLNRSLRSNRAARRLVVTHYPLDRMDAEDRRWLSRWLTENGVELLVSGHSHFHRTRCENGFVEAVVRGLDPDKAIGDLPGISLFESVEKGAWKEEFIPWSPAIRLLPADLPDGMLPVGWSIQGDPAKAARETLDFGLSCLEIRPSVRDFSQRALSGALGALRDRAPLHLSYHLPDLKWNASSGRVDGVETVRAHVECAMQAGADNLTVHVPRGERTRDGARSGRPARADSVFPVFCRDFRNPLQGRGERRGGDRNREYPQSGQYAGGLAGARIRYADRRISAMDRRRSRAKWRMFPERRSAHCWTWATRGTTGGDLDNLQPLGDWYARLGRRILGYHIHQVDTDPVTGRAYEPSRDFRSVRQSDLLRGVPLGVVHAPDHTGPSVRGGPR